MKTKRWRQTDTKTKLFKAMYSSFTINNKKQQLQNHNWELKTILTMIFTKTKICNSKICFIMNKNKQISKHSVQ